jgi:hypothetical protein
MRNTLQALAALVMAFALTATGAAGFLASSDQFPGLVASVDVIAA